MTYSIDYDLDKPGQAYRQLHGVLENLGGKRIMDSKWVLHSQSTAVQIRDYLLQFIDSNDRLIVAQMDGQWASWNLMFDPNKLGQTAA